MLSKQLEELKQEIIQAKQRANKIFNKQTVEQQSF